MGNDTKNAILVFCENGRFKLEFIERLVRQEISYDDLDEQLRELLSLLDNLRYFIYRAKELNGGGQN